MAAAFDKALGTGVMSASGTTFTITTTNTTAVGAEIFVGVLSQGNPTYSVADTGSNTYTQVGSNVVSGDGMSIALFKAAPAGSLASGATITVTMGTSQVRAVGSAMSATSVDVSTTDVALSGNTGFNATSVSTNAITTLTAADFIVAIIASSGAAAATIGSITNGFTSANGTQSQDTNNLNILYKVGTTAGTVADGQTGGTWSVSQSGGDNLQAIVAFKASTAVAALARPILSRLQAVNTASGW